MDVELSVPVQAELSGGHPRPVVTGSLTERDCRTLLPLLPRIDELTPGWPVRVDPACAYRAEPGTAELLRRAVERSGGQRLGGALGIVGRPQAHGYPGNCAPARRTAAPVGGRR